MEKIKLDDLNIYDVGNTIMLAGVIYSDEHRNYLMVLPGENSLDKNTVELEMTPADWKTFIRQTDLLEMEILAKQEDGLLAKTIVRKSARQLEQGISWKVFKRDAYTCRYCGNDDTPLTVDHVILYEEGGAHVEANLITACRKCNKTRGNMEYSKWLKSPYYGKVSKALPGKILGQNESILDNLDTIPRVQNIKSRG